jgi:hypothetical protein
MLEFATMGPGVALRAIREWVSESGAKFSSSISIFARSGTPAIDRVKCTVFRIKIILARCFSSVGFLQISRETFEVSAGGNQAGIVGNAKLRDLHGDLLVRSTRENNVVHRSPLRVSQADQCG